MRPIPLMLSLGAAAAITIPSSVPLPVAASTDESREPVQLSYEVITRRPHDDMAWTQGLQLDRDGRLFESTGMNGSSTIREVDALSGAVLRSKALPDDRFGEGLALVDDRLIQLTWRDGVATAWDVETFEPSERFSYEGEGWGLCFDGRHLVMSDGSDRLTFRDPDTFEVLGDVQVTLAGQPQARLNELECVGDAVWANVWLSDTIVRIDRTEGEVTGVLDLTGILDAHTDPGQRPPDVLNGIAWDASAGTFLVTGKLWPELIEIRVDEPMDPLVSSEPTLTADP